MAWVNAKINNRDLYQSYKKSLPSRSETDIGQFGKMMKRLSVPGFVRTVANTGIKYTIDRQKSFEWLQTKKYTHVTDVTA